MRGFLPDDAYTTVPAARVLRRADGLELAIAVPASLMLSQAGDSSDEVVTLRIACD